MSKAKNTSDGNASETSPIPSRKRSGSSSSEDEEEKKVPFFEGKGLQQNNKRIESSSEDVRQLTFRVEARLITPWSIVYRTKQKDRLQYSAKLQNLRKKEKSKVALGAMMKNPNCSTRIQHPPREYMNLLPLKTRRSQTSWTSLRKSQQNRLRSLKIRWASPRILLKNLASLLASQAWWRANPTSQESSRRTDLATPQKKSCRRARSIQRMNHQSQKKRRRKLNLNKSLRKKWENRTKLVRD